MKDIILVRLGEVVLKGLNRGKFEQKLMSNLARRLRQYGSFKIEQRQSRVWVEPISEDCDLENALKSCTQVFGIVSSSLVKRFNKDEKSITNDAFLFVENYLKQKYPLFFLDIANKTKSTKKITFKVEAKRGDKKFPLDSPQISAHVGGYLLHKLDFLEVDVHNPDIVLNIEVRDYIYMYCDKIEGLKGLPIGMSGRTMLLLSGGIDSPVAGFMMASRGVEVEAVYFHTPPYTSERAKQKIISLAEKLLPYLGRINLHIVDFTKVQLEINRLVPEEYLTVVMRRMMMRIAENIAHYTHCQSLTTGESLGQVASQTMEALYATNIVVESPVFRPLIGIDKDETIKLARKIGTFETSIEPYEDCCTVFVAKHPKTRPSLKEIDEAEKDLVIDSLLKQGLSSIETYTFSLHKEIKKIERDLSLNIEN